MGLHPEPAAASDRPGYFRALATIQPLPPRRRPQAEGTLQGESGADQAPLPRARTRRTSPPGPERDDADEWVQILMDSGSPHSNCLRGFASFTTRTAPGPGRSLTTRNRSSKPVRSLARPRDSRRVTEACGVAKDLVLSRLDSVPNLTRRIEKALATSPGLRDDRRAIEESLRASEKTKNKLSPRPPRRTARRPASFARLTSRLPDLLQG